MVVKVNQDQLKAIVAREHFKVAMEEVVHQGVAEEEEDHHMETVEEEDQHVEIGEKVEDNHQYKPIMPKENQLKRKKKSRKIRVLKLKMAFHSTLPSKMVLMFMNLKN